MLQNKLMSSKMEPGKMFFRTVGDLIDSLITQMIDNAK